MNKSIEQRCLFITSTRLGDAVLSTGLLNALHAQYPNAAVTVACGPLPAPLFEACPFVDKVIAIKKRKHHGHWIDLWKQVWTKRWDCVVDLRNTAVSRLIWRDKLYVMDHRIHNDRHKVEQYRQVMALDAPPAPHLWLPENSGAETLIPDGAPVLALSPASNWHAKTWPAERFIELTKALLAGKCKGWRVAIFAAAPERDQVTDVLKAFPDAIDAVGWGDPAQVAAALSRCQMFVGNDSGLMHMAAALGIETYGLFGPTKDLVYGAWGGTNIRTPESVAQLLDIPNYDSKTCPNLMQSLTVETVLNALNR